MVGTT
jgi:hypothetical protein